MKNKLVNKVTVIVFCLLIGVISVVNFCMPKKTFSENENRYLQQMPAFSFQSLFTREEKDKFTSKFESFITDQFAFRDGWVGMKTLAEKMILKKDSGGVYFAKDDYLIEMFDTVDQEQYDKNLNYLKTFSDKVQLDYGLTVNTMLVPTASYVLSDKLPSHAPEVSQDAMIEQAKKLLPGFIDLRQPLKEHSSEYIYYSTDHHWTSLGVYYAYQEWCKTAGIVTRPLEQYRQEILSESFYGTTYSKACLYTTAPDTITAFHLQEQSPVTVNYNSGTKVTDTMYESSHLSTKDKYSVFLDGNQPITQISTEHKNGKRLLIIKDSYANAFAPFAADDYEEIFIVDLRHMKSGVLEFVQANEINEILVLYNLKGFSSDNNLYLLNK